MNLRSVDGKALTSTALLEALETTGLGCTVILDHGDRLERIFANRAYAELAGCDLATIRRLPVLALVPAAERAEVEAFLRSFDRSEGSKTFETHFQRADRTTVPVQIQVGCLRLDGVAARIVFARDMSTELQMARQLRESEERFRALAAAAPDAIAVYAKGKCVYANPTARRHMGVGPEYDLRSIDPLANLTPERLAEIEADLDRLRRGEPVSAMVTRLRTVAGDETVLETRMALASIGGEEAILSMTRDITERVTLHAELMKQDRLASLGLLAAGVAHELNNPLTSVVMQVSRLRQDAERHGFPSETKASIEQLAEASQRMRSIIGDLLFLARPVEQIQTHIDLKQVLDSSIALVRAGMRGAPNTDVELAELPPVPGYASKLGQVFVNVILNAMQAVERQPDGLIRVAGRANDETVEITIADNGPGIPEHVLPHVTEPFFTNKVGGTGLGLWISQTLMAEHGGKLDVASTPNGTTVTLTLPMTSSA